MIRRTAGKTESSGRHALILPLPARVTQTPGAGATHSTLENAAIESSAACRCTADSARFPCRLRSAHRHAPQKVSIYVVRRLVILRLTYSHYRMTFQSGPMRSMPIA